MTALLLSGKYRSRAAINGGGCAELGGKQEVTIDFHGTIVCTDIKCQLDLLFMCFHGVSLTEPNETEAYFVPLKAQLYASEEEGSLQT